jgi:hypothetical protein
MSLGRPVPAGREIAIRPPYERAPGARQLQVDFAGALKAALRPARDRDRSRPHFIQPVPPGWMTEENWAVLEHPKTGNSRVYFVLTGNSRVYFVLKSAIDVQSGYCNWLLRTASFKLERSRDLLMTRRCKLVKKVAVLICWLACGPAMASSFSGDLPVGYSDNLFQIGAGASSLVIDVTALGARDPSICSFCNSSYTDNYTVNVFNQSGALLESANETNYLYYNMYSSSHGIGAGPIWMAVPAGATTVEIVSRLSIGGLLGSDGNPLNFGDLTISTDGSIAAVTPIPPTLPLLATGLAALGLLGWHRNRKAAAVIAPV